MLVVLLAALGAVAVGGLSLSADGSLTERWASDTVRANEVNHHAVGVGPAGEVVVAPVAETPGAETAVTDESCALVRLDPADGSTVWARGLPAADCFTHALTEPAVTDVDDDGSLEAVVATTAAALVARDATTGDVEWRVPLSTYGYGRPTVGNLTPHPGREVVAVDVDGGVVAATGDGRVLWRETPDAVGWRRAAVWAAPVVADVDADGTPEVVVGGNRGVAVFGPDGTVERRVDVDGTHLAAADVDADPALELLTAGASRVVATDGRTGDREWAVSAESARLRTVTDGDGAPEAYLGLPGGEVRALDARTSDHEWTATVGSAVVVPPVTGDVDGDGAPEVVAATNAGTVVVLDAASGDERAAYERPVPVWTFPTLADLDGDGASEVVVRYGDGRVVALSYRSSGASLAPEAVVRPPDV